MTASQEIPLIIIWEPLTMVGRQTYYLDFCIISEIRSILFNINWEMR